MQDFVHNLSRAPKQIREIRSIGQECPGYEVLTDIHDHRQPRSPSGSVSAVGQYKVESSMQELALLFKTNRQ
jgi:hypothetical protein